MFSNFNSLRKKQPFKVVFYFVVKGVGGLKLRSALQLRSVAEAKEPPFLFFGRGRGFTSPAARNCEQTYLRSVAFLCVVLRTRNCQKQTRPRLLAAASAATRKPPPIPLHVRGGDTALLVQSVASLNLTFLRCRSRRVKFINLAR